MSLAVPGDEREHPERPWVGVGVIVWRDDQVLLIKRGRPPRRGEWGIPGGAQALGETIFETAIREVLEETGISIRPTAIVTAIDSITPGRDGKVLYHYTLIEVSAEWVAGEAVAASDVEDVCWAARDRVAGCVGWSETARIVAEAGLRRDARPP